ncbi:DUF1542 domain-containing protein [Fructobacillus sp. M1-21]|uniref:DUF1542 domain-containing protein n=2 Tax=Fructobacillus papyrifericola TaxID=2713172 RepID=A0ABS5QUZ9_9LACO|nr:DUF1542 domain-containing protein [Fructobacillus papyrifericola]
MSKEHKKMYKAGKRWIEADLMGFALISGIAAVTSMINIPGAPGQEVDTEADADDISDANLKVPYTGTIYGTTVTFDSIEDAVIGQQMDLPAQQILTSNGQTLTIAFTHVYVHLGDNGQLVGDFEQSQTHFLISQTKGYPPIVFHWNPDFGPHGGDHTYTLSGTYTNWTLANNYYKGAQFYLVWNGQTYHFNFVDFRTQDQVNNIDIPSYRKKVAGSDTAKKTKLIQLQQAVSDAKKQIANNEGLTKAQKNDLDNQIDAAFNAGINKMKADFTQDDVNTDGDAAKTNIINLGNTPGVDVKKLKSDLTASLQSEADKVIAEIKADDGLTTTDRNSQIAKVNADLTTYTNKVNGDSDMDDMNSDTAAGKSAIDADYTKGDLDAVKTAAKAKIDALAQKLINEIKGDNTLTQAAKDQQVQAVQNDQNRLDNKINQDQTADDAQADGQTDFSSDYVPGDSIANQKAAAKAKAAAEAQKILSDIKNDPTLPETVRKTQIDAVNSDLKTADDNIDAASDADDINSQTINGISSIDGAHVPGDPLPDQKSKAKAAIDAEANTINNAINNDNTLTSGQKSAELAKVTQSVTDAKNAIDQASDADSISTAKGNGITAIDGDHTAGVSLDSQKKAAKKVVDDEAQKLINEINGDNTLTSTQKSAQTAAITQDQAQADQNIDNATNADGVNSSRDAGFAKVDSDYKPGDSIQNQKTKAKAAVDAAAAAAKNAINNDVTLTTDQKATQLAQVETDRTNADNSIDAGTNADGINSSRDAGINQINGVHQPGTDLADQKSAAKLSLEAEERRVEAQINGDSTLTTNQKAAEIAQAQGALTTAEKNIDSAENADAVNSTLSSGKQTIDQAYQPGTPLKDAKTQAKAKVDAEEAKIIAAIKADGTLSQSDQNSQIAAAQADDQTADQNIDNATSADGIQTAVTNGIQNIDNDHVLGTPLDQQKQAAKASVDAEANKLIGVINGDNTLSVDAKASQVAKVKADQQAADQNIDQAANKDAIQSAMTTGIAKIDADHTAGQSLDQQRTAAINKLKAEAAKVDAAIEADKTLDTADRQKQEGWVNNDLQSAINNVNNSGTADAISTSLTNGVSAMDNDHVPGDSIANQKKAAQKAIDDAAKQALDGDAQKAIAGINNDPTIPAAEKQKQIDRVNADKQAAIDNINKASDADGINNAVKDGKAAIASDYAPGESLDQQKKEAKAAVDAEAAKVIAAINDDSTLTAADKSKQVANVKASQKTADDAIDAASDADGIQNQESNGIQAIDNDHVPGASLASQKAAAKQQLEDEAKKVINAIQNDSSLTTAQKTAQTNQVTTDKNAAEAKIDADGNADSVKTDLSAGLAAIDADHKAGTSVADQKKNQKQLLANEAAKIIAEINADNTLSTTTKNAQIAQVNADETTWDNAIDQATDADDITTAFNSGKTAIDNDYVPGKPLPDQKNLQKSNLEAEAQRIIDAINGDVSLTAAEKEKQVSQVKADLATAEGQIDQANDQDTVNSDFKSGKQTIDDDHVSKGHGLSSNY